MITEKQVQKAIRDVASSGKSVELKDAGARGAGRLALRVVPGGAAEWYAVYYTAGRRKMAKLGGYPLLRVAEARKAFSRDWAPKVAAGEASSVARRQAAAAGTFGDLCDAYVAHLESSAKRTAKAVGRMLNLAKKAIGAQKPAAKVTAADIVPYLAAIHARGSEAHANVVRGYLGAAFAFGLRAEHDFTRQRADARWSLTVNPVLAIPTGAARKVGNRFLSAAELRTVWLWMVEYRKMSLMASAVLLRIATGQRTEEVLRITTASYEPAKAMLHWEKTKNGLPHSIPLPRQAVEVLDAMAPNRHGLYFPQQFDPTIPADQQSVRDAIMRFLSLHPDFAPFTARDLRRTFKTLGGDAGISKEMRDRLQNHVEGGVSAKHYDRYGYLPERRAAMDKWADYLDRVIDGTVDADRRNVVPLRKAEEAA